MAVQFSCDICGGKLVMKGAGIAVCSECGMEYDAAYLKEKISGGTSASPSQPITSQPAPNQQIQNLLSMARSAAKQPTSAKFWETIDKILTIDYKNKEAWILKASHRPLEDAEEFYSLFQDEASRQELLQAYSKLPIFHVDLYNIKTNTANLEAIDIRLADIFLAKNYKEKLNRYEQDITEIKNRFAAEERNKPRDIYSCNPEMIVTDGCFQDFYKYLPLDLDYTLDLLKFISKKEYKQCVVPITNWLDRCNDFLSSARNFKEWKGTKQSRSSMYYTHSLQYKYDYKGNEFSENEKKIRDAKAMINTLHRNSTSEKREAFLNQKKSTESESKKTKIKNITPEEREALLNQKKSIESELEKTKMSIDTCWDSFYEIPVVKKCTSLFKTIDRLKQDISNTFNPFKKSKLKAQLADFEAELRSIEDEYDKINSEYEKKFDELVKLEEQLTKQLKKVNNTLKGN